MSTNLKWDMASMQNHLAHLTSEGRLYFACSCIERLLPIAELWPKEAPTVAVRELLNRVWLSTTKDLTVPESSIMKALGDSLEELTANRDFRPQLVMYLADASLSALHHFLSYLNTSDVVSILHCSSRTHGAAHSFGKVLVEYDPTVMEPYELAIPSQPVQDELQKQRYDLQRLMTDKLTQDTILEIRRESQEMGIQFVAQVQQYLVDQESNWVRAKMTYPTGSQIGGYVEYPTHVYGEIVVEPDETISVVISEDVPYLGYDGVVIKLDETTNAIIPVDDPHPHTLEKDSPEPMLRQELITGVVVGYDDENRFIIVTSPHIP